MLSYKNMVLYTNVILPNSFIYRIRKKIICLHFYLKIFRIILTIRLYTTLIRYKFMKSQLKQLSVMKFLF